MSKEDREDCKKLVADKLKEVNEKGGSKKWVVRIRGQQGPSMTLLAEEEQSNELSELIELDFPVLWVTFDFDLSYLVKLCSFSQSRGDPEPCLGL